MFYAPLRQWVVSTSRSKKATRSLSHTPTNTHTHTHTLVLSLVNPFLQRHKCLWVGIAGIVSWPAVPWVLFQSRDGSQSSVITLFSSLFFSLSLSLSLSLFHMAFEKNTISRRECQCFRSRILDWWNECKLIFNSTQHNTVECNV